MPFDSVYHVEEPTREEIDQSRGLMVLEFGADWCGHCQAIAPHMERLFREYPDVKHIRIADGRGKRLGRSFRVKLWPTLIFLRDGQSVVELVRPAAGEMRMAFEQLQSEAES
jgi:thioredoxin 1